MVIDSAGEIFGDAPNIAARVQALAEPGAVLVTARVQRQVPGLFVAEDRGARTLKGVPEPTTLFAIVRASGGGRRSSQRALTPLIGRNEEITMLARRWDRARQGEGQFVQIVGEPGLGKSRLIEEFHARLRDTPHTWVEWSSSQLLQNTPLHPIAEWGRQRFGAADLAPEQRLADLESTLAQIKLDPADYVPLLAPLVDIPLPPERAANLPPDDLRRRQMAAMLAWVMAGARYAACRAGVRGPALGRSDNARRSAGLRRARRAGAASCSCHNSAGLSRAVGRALAPRHDHARAAGSGPGPADGWRARPTPRLVEGNGRWGQSSAPAACRCSLRK